MPFIETPKFSGAIAGVDHLQNWVNFGPNGAGTLNAGINDTVTTFVFTAGHGARYPLDNFTIEIDDERMFVGSRSTDTCSSVVREIDGTTKASHSAGAPVEHFIDARALNRMASEINAIENHLLGMAMLQPIGGIVKPVNGDFSWVNQGSSTVTVASDGRIHLFTPAAHSGFAIRTKTAPGTPYTCTVGLAMPWVLTADDGSVALTFRESSTGKLILFIITNATSGNVDILSQDRTNPTTFSANNKSVSNCIIPSPLWMRLEDDGVNLKMHYSVDGEHFEEFWSEGRTVFLAGGPNEIGFSVAPSSASHPISTTVIHWEEA